MEAKRISQRAVKSIINSNTVLLHIGNFETGKRTNLRRAVDECVYTSRLYYNTEIYSEREKMNYLSLKHNDKLFEVKLYETHIAAINEYEVIQNASLSDFVFKGFYNNGIGNWCIYEINGIEYVPMSQPYIIGRYE